jgi:hypothetical protein
MDDEVARSTAKTKPLKGFEETRRQPVPLLFGLTIGLVLAWVLGALAPPFAPLLPLVIGGPLLLFKRTQALALGVLAAACGVVVFLVTGFLLIWIF